MDAARRDRLDLRLFYDAVERPDNRRDISVQKRGALSVGSDHNRQRGFHAGLE